MGQFLRQISSKRVGRAAERPIFIDARAAAALLVAAITASLLMLPAAFSRADPLSAVDAAAQPADQIAAAGQTPVQAVTATASSADIMSQIGRQQVDLDQKQTQLAAIDQQLAGSQQALHQNRLDLAEATSRLQRAEDDYDASLKLYEGRIAAIYKLGDREAVSVVLSADSFSDALTRMSYLESISENDRKLVAQVKVEAEQVRQLREQVDGLKQVQAGSVDTLQLRRAQLAADIATSQAQEQAAEQQLAQAQAREQQDEESRRLAAEADAQAAPEGQNTADAGSSDEGDNAAMALLGPSAVVSPQPPAGIQPTGAVLRGVASWYGPGFNGHRTANGEIYNMYAYTAAHKTLPFNTWLKVTFNGRSVFVRINDRGPYVGSRIIDLSFASAQALGIRGVGYVTAEVYR